jgi:hypothetical protein
LASAGLKYPLNSEALCVGTRGISNEIQESPVSLRVITGVIVMFVENGICVTVFGFDRQLSRYAALCCLPKESAA